MQSTMRIIHNGHEESTRIANAVKLYAEKKYPSHKISISSGIANLCICYSNKKGQQTSEDLKLECEIMTLWDKFSNASL